MLYGSYTDTPERINDLASVVTAIRSALKKSYPQCSFTGLAMLRPSPETAFLYAPTRLHAFLREATRHFEEHQATTESDIVYAMDTCMTQEEHGLLEYVMGRPLVSMERDVLPKRAELRYTTE